MKSRISQTSKPKINSSFNKTMISRKSNANSRATRKSFNSKKSFSKTLNKSSKLPNQGILNLGDLGPSGPLMKKPNEIQKKGMLYSKNKVNAIVNRIKSPIVVNSQKTYYITRFADFERSMHLFQSRQQQTRSGIVSELESIRLKFQEMKKKVEASRNHKKELIESLKSLKLVKAKFAKANNLKTNLIQKDDKKNKKMTTAKINSLRKDLNVIRIDGEQRLHKLTSKVQGLLSEFKNEDKHKSKIKGVKKGKKLSAQKVQKTCLAYVKRAKLLIKDHKSKLNMDFENTLKMHRNNIVVKLGSYLEEIRKERRKNHYKLHEFVHNTEHKVNNMLKEKEVQLEY
jgi:hypothetical protein